VINMAPRKIAIAAIERLQRTLESTPECPIAEVTKIEAIRMLSPQIHAMRSKGYGLGVIAGVLSENGVAVTPVTLKGYLKQLRAAGGKTSARKSRQRRGSRDSQANAPANPARSPEGVQGEEASSSPKAGREGSVGPERGGPAGASSGAAASGALTSKGSAPPADAGAPRLSAFVPREDTRDI
jgi:hypothetical protein